MMLRKLPNRLPVSKLAPFSSPIRNLSPATTRLYSSSPNHGSFPPSRHTPTSGFIFGPVVLRPIPIPIPIPPTTRRHLPSASFRLYATSSKPPNSPPPVDKAVKSARDVEVSPSSTTRPILDEIGTTQPVKTAPGHDTPMSSAIAGDLKAIQETFALKAVPRDAYILGIAGTIPYLGTALGTLYCAYDLHYSQTRGNGLLMQPEFAEQMITYLENLQISYGAVILSFLGAIHWGLEFAKYSNQSSRTRYALGLIAPLIAWPTTFLAYEYALGAQFLGFTVMYWADSHLTSRGLAPPWYATYRFVLTLIVGMSIVISLIGRGEVEVIKEGSRSDLMKKGQESGKSRQSRYETEKAAAWDAKKAQEEKAKKEKEEKEKKEQEEKEKKAKENEDDKDDKDDKKKDE